MKSAKQAVKPLKPKLLHQSSILGQQGINLIEKICLAMGYVWHPTGNLETGIDGYIEIRNPVTGETTNSIVQVQSKATGEEFQAETELTFEYTCDERDLDYWMRGNAPVILIRSRPKTDEAYWVSIKDYFSISEKRRSRKILFSKERDRFSSSEVCAVALRQLAIPKDSGFYFAPIPKTEKIYTNLVKVNFPDRLYIARTDYRYPRQVWESMGTIGVSVGSDFLMSNKSIMSFHPLDEYPWNSVCDSGTCEGFGTVEWANSHDPDRLRDFVQLLNTCLKEKAWQSELKYSARCECYYFRATSDLSPRRIRYQSFKEETSRQVFRGYFKTGDIKREKVYYRHSAFMPQFFRHEDQWYLEITPTYYFTWDGIHLDEFYEEKLKKIKMMERNLAVVGQVIMWIDYLSRKKDLFSAPYPFLIMGDHLVLDLDHGIPDDLWLPKEDEETQSTLKATEPTFFDE
jgi:hypothetical protein